MASAKGGEDKRKSNSNGGNGEQKPGVSGVAHSSSPRFCLDQQPITTKGKEDFMNKQFRVLSGFGLLALLVMGTVVPNSQADNGCLPKSPVRGAWSFSQSTQTFYPPLSLLIPATEVGTLTIDACGHSTGHGTINDLAGGIEFDFTGDCVLRENGGTVMDCTNHAFGETSSVVCALMEKTGECFQEFRCVSTRPYDVTQPGPVILAELKRVYAGTCK